MFVYVTWGRIKLGHWDDYQRLFLDSNADLLGVHGLRARWLLRDLDDENAGFAISLWDTENAVEQFIANPVIAELRATRFLDVYTGTEAHEGHPCEVRVAMTVAPSESSAAADGELSAFQS